MEASSKYVLVCWGSPPVDYVGRNSDPHSRISYTYWNPSSTCHTRKHVESLQLRIMYDMQIYVLDPSPLRVVYVAKEVCSGLPCFLFSGAYIATSNHEVHIHVPGSSQYSTCIYIGRKICRGWCPNINLWWADLQQIIIYLHSSIQHI